MSLSLILYLDELSHSESRIASPCGWLGGDCARLRSSAWAAFPPRLAPGGLPSATSTEGIPAALLGVWHFSSLLLWFLLVGLTRSKWHLVPVVEATLASVYAALMVGILLLERSLCPLCVACHVISCVIVICLLLSSPGLPAVVVRPSPTSSHPFAVVALAGILAVALGQHWRIANGVVNDDLATLLLDAHMTQEAREVPVSANDPIMGPRDATCATLAVFFDAQCPPCQAFSRTLVNQILPRSNGRLRVVLKHFPLCRDCNLYSSNVHPDACKLAYLLEGSRLQGGMDAFLRLKTVAERLDGALDDERLVQLAREAGLDDKSLRRTSESPEIKELVHSHVRQGQRLGITATPYLMLEGRPLDLRIAAIPEFWKAVGERAASLGAGIEMRTVSRTSEGASSP